MHEVVGVMMDGIPVVVLLDTVQGLCESEVAPNDFVRGEENVGNKVAGDDGRS